MSNRTNSNKTIAKIQIILGLATVLLFGTTSCERKDLFLRVDMTDIRVEMYDIGLDLLWGVDWETEWQYSWNETLSNFGTVGYTKPDLIKATIYSVDPYTGKRFNSFFKIFDSNGGRVSLNAGSTYDMMFYNFGTEYTSFIQSDDFESYTASTRMSNQSSWIRTRGESASSEMPDTTKTYIDYNQPDEVFGTLVTDLEISEDPSCYEKEYDADGNITYIYKVDAALRPYTFIYLYQIVVLNNADEKGNRIVGSKGITVTGLSQGVEMFSRKTLNNTISISTDEVKPMQHHENVRIDENTTVESADIMAARVLTWGLPGITPLDLTKAGTKAKEIDKNYIGVGLTLRNGVTYTVTKDITDEMHSKPTGGVITIFIDGSSVPQDLLDQKQQSGGGFNASVEDWANEVNAELVI